MEERTIVLLGKTGVGKSATGNTILRMNTFQSRRSVDSVTKQCQVEQAVISGKRIRVVDTPGLFDTEKSEEELAKELARSVYQSREGVHAFILVFPYGTFTEQEEEIILRIQKVFGKKVTNHMIILFTHGDGVENDEIERSSNRHLKTSLEKCGGRYQLFNNKGQNNREQIPNLLEMIEGIVELNGGKAYTNEVYEVARRYTWENFWEYFKELFFKAAAILIGKLKQRVQVITEGVSRVAVGLMSEWMQKMEEKQRLL